ncbi:hypothetical protein EDB89DRAFT_1577167 [Lactarius sanguifluus]|nr:hypothetical protein EDB89DRAFT_1577167 [Lactarius sanguifluus]
MFVVRARVAYSDRFDPLHTVHLPNLTSTSFLWRTECVHDVPGQYCNVFCLRHRASRSPFLFALRSLPRSNSKLDEYLLAQQHHHHPGLVEIYQTTEPHTHTINIARESKRCRPVSYFTAYKQSEHYLPHADPQARGQDPRCPTHGAHDSRNIPSVNRTDVPHLVQSFTKIAQAPRIWPEKVPRRRSSCTHELRS